MNVFEILKHRGTKSFGRYYGIYRAKVLENNDEEKRGRIVIEIPGVRARIIARPMFRFAGNGYGELCVPEVGDTVYVMFEDGDVRYPIYVGGWFAKQELPEEFASCYPNVRGVKTKYGHSILLDDENKKTTVITKDNRKVVLDDKNDKIIIDNNGKKQIVLKGNEILIGGESATQPLVLSFRLITLLNKIIAWMTAVGTAVGVPPQSFGVEPQTPNSLCNMKHKQTSD